ncbi:MAG: TolC family protein [bacterium]|nr:TolC family protein [bacterium]
MTNSPKPCEVTEYRDRSSSLTTARTLPRVGALAALVLFNALNASAEPPDPALEAHAHIRIEPQSSLSLREVIRTTAAQEAGTEVIAARRAEADAFAWDAKRLWPEPPSLSANHVTDRIGTDDGYRQWNTGLELPLWWPGQRRGRRNRARAAAAAAGHAEQAHLLEVAGWVRQAIAELALAGVRVELAEAEWRAEDALADQIERAVALQELSERDLLLARSASLDSRIHFLEALEESRHAEGDYALLTGLSASPSDWTEATSERTTLEAHPLLLLARENIARAEAEIRKLQNDQWGHPVVAFGSQHERDAGNDDFDNRILAGLRIPLGRRGDTRVELAMAQRALAESQRDTRRLERRLQGALAQAEHRLALAGERARTATERARMASEYRRLTEIGFGLGEADPGTLLRARALATSAEQTRRETQILYQFGIAELNQALGVIP